MRLFKLLWLWLQVVGGIVAIGAICWLIVQSVFHLKLLDVQTGSMRPTFRPGDELVMRASREVPRVGTIVSYHSSCNPKELVTHRVVKVMGGSFQTKGDALTAPDPVVRNALLAGNVVAVLPNMGRLLTWLTTLLGLITCVYAPAAAIAASELYRLERHYATRDIYRLEGVQVV